MPRRTHPVCTTMRDLRRTTGRSLQQIQDQFGINAVVVGSYERGDRQPTLNKVEAILNVYGYTLKAVPMSADAVRLPADICAELRAIAEQIERKEKNSILAVEQAADEARQQQRIDAGIEWSTAG